MQNKNLNSNQVFDNFNLKIVFLLSVFCLLIAHLANKEAFGEEMAFITIIIEVLVLVMAFLTFLRQNFISIFLVLFITNHFLFALNYGGLFILISFLVIFTITVLSNNNFELLPHDFWLNFLLAIFILFNILGWIVRPSGSIMDIMVAIVAFFGYIFVFKFSNSLYLTPKRASAFFKIIIVLLVYSSLMMLNNSFKIYRPSFETPLLNTANYFGGETGTGQIVTNMFGVGEIGGEWALILTFLLMIQLMSSSTKQILKIKSVWLIIGIIGGLISILLTFSKSLFILLVIGAIIILFIQFFKIVTLNQRIGPVLYIAFFIILLFLVAPLLDLSFIFDRFDQYGFLDRLKYLTFTDLLQGEGINRDQAFTYAFTRFGEDSWWIGYGWGARERYRIALFGIAQHPRLDFHNMYFSLPMLFGWVGGTSFLLIILTILRRLVKYVFILRNSASYYVPILIGLIFAIVICLLNEYKISMLSFPNYFMIFWFLLGFACMTINSIKKDYSI